MSAAKRKRARKLKARKLKRELGVRKDVSIQVPVAAATGEAKPNA